MTAPGRATPRRADAPRRVLACTVLLAVLGALAALGTAGTAAGASNASGPVVEGPHSRACIGAGAMDPNRVCPPARRLITSPEDAFEDISIGYTKCLMWPPYPDETLSCVLGDSTRPRARIALFGNSHAGHWAEALSRIAKEHHWQLDTFIMGACFSTLEPSPDPCSEIRSKVAASILGGHYDLVIMATFDDNPQSRPATYASTLQDLTGVGSNVLVIRDTPVPGPTVPLTTDCLLDHPRHWKKCAGRTRDWVSKDRLAQAAKQLGDPRIRTVDLTRFFCRDGTCPAVIGGEIPYRDTSHLTVTFTRSLIPYLRPAVEAAMATGRS